MYFFVCSSNSKASTRDMIDKGLRSVSQNDFEEGLAFFQSALKTEPHNVTVCNTHPGVKCFQSHYNLCSYRS